MVLAEPKMSRIDTSQLDVRSLTRVVGITSDPDRKLMVIPEVALKLTAAVRGNAYRLVTAPSGSMNGILFAPT